MKFIKKIVLATLLTLTATASLAQGVEHRVVIERWGYFPTPIYVQPGDTIVFENRAPNWVNLQTDDASDNLTGYNVSNPCATRNVNGQQVPYFSGAADGFSTPWFGVGATRTIAVTPCIETRFLHPVVSGLSHNSAARIDLIVFGTAPNGN